MTAEKNRTANIMVVDDTIANLKLLEGILGRRGYRVRSFPRGRLALAAAVVEPPDLILLDINIPEMNGYEMCEKLKANPALAPIPVVFISALNEMLDKARAFGCGGVDYINKPFQIEEILVRVETHVSRRRLQRQLDDHLLRHEELGGELAAANERLRMVERVKNDFIVLTAQELSEQAAATEALLAALPAPMAGMEQVDAFRLRQAQLLRVAEHAASLAQLRADFGHGAAETFLLSPVLRHAMNGIASQASRRQVGLPEVPDDLPLAAGNAQLMHTVFGILLETVVTLSGERQNLDLACVTHGDEVHVMLTIWGATISEPELRQLFQEPAQGQLAPPEGKPLPGLSLAGRIAVLFGGSVAVESQLPAGVKLTVRLKTARRSETFELPGP